MTPILLEVLDTIAYVTGTVNGVSVIFTQQEPGLWRTDAAPADDGIYTIIVLAYDALGRSSELRATIHYGWRMPVYDRTKADVDLAERLRAKSYAELTPAERVLWNSWLKGFYNSVDLNRVENNTEYLADVLNGYGYNTALAHKTDWERGDLLSGVDAGRYLNNVKELRLVYLVLPTTPQLPDNMHNLDYIGANAIEKNLLDMHTLIGLMERAWHYSGEIYSGEV